MAGLKRSSLQNVSMGESASHRWTQMLKLSGVMTDDDNCFHSTLIKLYLIRNRTQDKHQFLYSVSYTNSCCDTYSLKNVSCFVVSLVCVYLFPKF